ncbi:MAG: hypothetical protein PHD95_06055 [Candidatus ainarchaeum sp.]|nr:hypothetical protein [Candidatus ainarchaeum sp.]
MGSGKKKAFFSLFDTEKCILFAKELERLGWEIIATGETSGLLNKNGVKAVDISEFLGFAGKYPFPPTLHPKMELALATNEKESIGLVYVITYPLSHGNDVGGHTLLGLAAKGKKIVVSNKEDMAMVISELGKNNNEIDSSLRQELIEKAFLKIACHFNACFSALDLNHAGQVKIIKLAEGENPYQSPAELFHLNSGDSLAIGNFRQESGVAPCFTNIADFDSILKTFCLAQNAFYLRYKKTPNIVIAAKHGNPCGFAVSWDSKESAIENALWGNPRAVWGGELVANFYINKRLAEKLYQSKKRQSLFENSGWMLDVVAAPGFDKEAVQILGKRPERKLFSSPALEKPFLEKNFAYRQVRGGFLRQPPGNYVLNFEETETDFGLPGKNALDSLIIAWATAWSSSHGGNEVAIAKNRKLLGIGGGPSTFDSCFTAIDRAEKNCHLLKGSAFAADAFFPFTDAALQLIGAGCGYGIVPKGGKKFEAVKKCFKESSVRVFYLPEKFRGFCRH